MIHAVYFDAVGTLIHPRPAAADVYCAIGRRHGSRLDRTALAQRFGAAFQRQEDRDRTVGWRTDEARERTRWREIVAEVLDDVSDPEACFTELYAHFAAPEAWLVEPGTEAMLARLRRRGFRLGMASNYDHRLRAVVAGLPALRDIERLLISSEIGWRKPAPEFFAALCRQVDLPPSEIVYVGDDRVNDYDGARAAGLQAVLAPNS